VNPRRIFENLKKSILNLTKSSNDPMILSKGDWDMDISKARCADCDRPMEIHQMVCNACNLKMEAEFEVPPLARLSVEDQLFVTAFVRHHGSIKKMESLFGISYPTVKNRLNAIAAALDQSFQAPPSHLQILEQLERGEITVAEAIERMEP
jgi:hypothetical protein